MHPKLYYKSIICKHRRTLVMHHQLLKMGDIISTMPQHSGYTQTHTQTDTRIYIQHAYTQTHTLIHIDTLAHTHTHTRTHTHTHTHTHTYTHSHTHTVPIHKWLYIILYGDWRCYMHLYTHHIRSVFKHRLRISPNIENYQVSIN